MCKDLVNLAFVTNGGVRKQFIQANFIYYVSKYLKGEPVRIEVFAHSSRDLNDAVFLGQSFVDAYYSSTERYRALSEYDVSVSLDFYPEILVARGEKIVHCPKLLRLLDGWKQFLSCDEGRRFYVNNFGLDINGQILAIIQGKNCLNILDVTGELGVSRDYGLRLLLHKSETETLKQWGLQTGEYITLQRGAYPSLNVSEVPKIWPVDYYDELVRLLKKCFPDKKIVQLGESKERCSTIQGADISLVGKTDWEDIKVLLKNAWLHIDGECGMVHLRKILQGGPSVVFFGPTSVDFYGYDGNINIFSDACPHWCCKLTESAAERCLLNGEDNNRCMKTIQPFHVMDRIVEWAYMMAVKQGTSPMKGVSSADIELKGVCFDDDFANNIMPGRYIYYDEIKEIPLRDLHVVYHENHVKIKRPLEESPAYLLLNGNSEEYQAELVRQETLCEAEVHSFEKFHKLRQSMEKEYDERYKIVIWPDCRVYDGHHRASILMWKNGMDCVKEVLVLYTIVMFPFCKVPRGSKIVLYGFGEIGQTYLRQIKLSEYVSVVRIIDQNAHEFTNLEKTQGIGVGHQEELFSGMFEFDFIVLAMGNPQSALNVKKCLLEKGIDEDKIIAQDGLIYI